MTFPTTRECVRALILSPGETVLLVHLVLSDRDLWIAPGGGIDAGESHHQALERELREEVGRTSLTIGPHIWTREGTFDWEGRIQAEREYFYLVRSDEFVADLSGNPSPVERELLAEYRWWPAWELPRRAKNFAPRRLGALVADLIRDGAPATPIEVGF